MYSPSTQPAFALDAAASVYCYAPLIRTVPLPPTPSSPCFVPCGPHHLPSESVKGEPTDVALCRAPRMKTIPLPEAGNALGVHLYDSQLSAMDSGGDVTRTGECNLHLTYTNSLLAHLLMVAVNSGFTLVGAANSRFSESQKLRQTLFNLWSRLRD